MRFLPVLQGLFRLIRAVLHTAFGVFKNGCHSVLYVFYLKNLCINALTCVLRS
jgi:hypothetical protein